MNEEAGMQGGSHNLQTLENSTSLTGKTSPADEVSDGWQVVRHSTTPVNRKDEGRGMLRGDRWPRKNCLIFSNVPESPCDTLSTRIQGDTERFIEILNKLLDEGEAKGALKRIRREGAKDPDGKRPRLLHIVLDSAAAAKQLLSRGYRLAGTSISMRPDLCPEDRKRQREAVTELKQRLANGETDLKVVNFRVVHKIPRPLTRPTLLCDLMRSS